MGSASFECSKTEIRKGPEPSREIRGAKTWVTTWEHLSQLV